MKTQRNRIALAVAALLTGLPRPLKFAVTLAADLAITVAVMFFVALLVTADAHLPSNVFPLVVALGPLLTVVFMWLMGGYRVVTRYFGLTNLVTVGAATLGAGVGMAAVAFATGTLSALDSLIAMYVALAGSSLGTLRLLAMALLSYGQTPARAPRAIIYGAGQAGRQLALALGPSERYRVVGFVDDDSRLHGRSILGVRVCPPESLTKRKEKGDFDLVLLALPSQTRAVRRRIFERLEQLSVRVMTLPGVDELESTSRVADSIRDVDVADLLGRDAVEPDENLMAAFIQDQVVMVTGGGGSIGSELARQVMERGARKLVLFEVSEFALYTIDAELRAALRERETLDRNVEVVPVLGSVLDRRLLRRTIAEHGVDTIYHAAAYKHVPLVQSNPLSGIQNNVFGTLLTVDEAGKGGVKQFVLVSTDKAVRPTSTMGAAKRVSELVVQARAARYPNMGSAIVRFGNVLGSSGSVVPVFKAQLEAGGPMTVTHPDVTRYFMTIPEAAQLVIQAGAMGRQGDVFLLDMGQSTKIVDLAKRMVRLSGLTVKDEDSPDGEIEIVFTGLRPGEKLYEELLIDEAACETSHQRIFRSPEVRVEPAEVDRFLAVCRSALRVGDASKVLESVLQIGQRARSPVMADQLSASEIQGDSVQIARESAASQSATRAFPGVYRRPEHSEELQAVRSAS